MKIFPKKIEKGTVLFYTNKGWYGSVPTPPSGIPTYKITYVAISSFDGESEFHLCFLDDSFKVIDFISFASVKECMELAKSSTKALETDDIKWNSHPYISFK